MLRTRKSCAEVIAPLGATSGPLVLRYLLAAWLASLHRNLAPACHSLIEFVRCQVLNDGLHRSRPSMLRETRRARSKGRTISAASSAGPIPLHIRALASQMGAKHHQHRPAPPRHLEVARCTPSFQSVMESVHRQAAKLPKADRLQGATQKALHLQLRPTCPNRSARKRNSKGKKERRAISKKREGMPAPRSRRGRKGFAIRLLEPTTIRHFFPIFGQKAV